MLPYVEWRPVCPWCRSRRCKPPDRQGWYRWARGCNLRGDSSEDPSERPGFRPTGPDWLVSTSQQSCPGWSPGTVKLWNALAWRVISRKIETSLSWCHSYCLKYFTHSKPTLRWIKPSFFPKKYCSVKKTQVSRKKWLLLAILKVINNMCTQPLVT